MSKCDERFARQYRYEPPPGFPLASPCSDIVHHLSGPNRCAHTQTSLRRSWPVVGAPVPTVTFTSHTSLELAYSHMCMDSLVRVSRRVVRTLAGQHCGESRQSAAPWRREPCLHESQPLPERQPRESSRPHFAVNPQPPTTVGPRRIQDTAVLVGR